MTPQEIDSVLAEHLPGCLGGSRRVLLIVPDGTRTAPVGDLVKRIIRVVHNVGVGVDILVALGTHPPLPREMLLSHLGMSEELYAADYSDVTLMNHVWDDPEQLECMAELSADEVDELSGGLLNERVELTLNRVVRDYDRLLVLGPVFPHALVGFSGGSKYFFPGISGPEMIDIVHWLGALQTSMKTIGHIDTPIRRVLNAAVDHLSLNITGISVVAHHGGIEHLGVGDLHTVWRDAAEVSRRIHVMHTGRRYGKVLACCPPMYPDLWTGGKCMYKCESVVEDGGELIIYAPHVQVLSEVHDATIHRLGYHVRDYFLAHMDRYRNESRAVMAYCCVVKGSGKYENGIETPRIRVSVASGVSREICEKLGLGYIDPATIDPDEWKDREDEGVLLVEKAGETLYLPA